MPNVHPAPELLTQHAKAADAVSTALQAFDALLSMISTARDDEMPQVKREADACRAVLDGRLIYVNESRCAESSSAYDEQDAAFGVQQEPAMFALAAYRRAYASQVGADDTSRAPFDFDHLTDRTLVGGVKALIAHYESLASETGSQILALPAFELRTLLAIPSPVASATDTTGAGA